MGLAWWVQASRVAVRHPPRARRSIAGRRVLDLIAQIREQRGLTTVMVTHDQSVAARADRIVEILDGRLAPHADKPSVAAARRSFAQW